MAPHRRSFHEAGHAHELTCSCYHSYHTSLGEILKAIKAPVARRAIAYLEEAAPEWLPRITRVRGNQTERLCWQSGGGYDRNVTDPRTLHTMPAYIHANPVRKGLVQRPEDWNWSSAAWHDDLSGGPLRLGPISRDWLE